MEMIDTKIRFDDVNALIGELEAQFGEERMLPQNSAVPDCNTNNCTFVYTCTGSCRTQ